MHNSGFEERDTQVLGISTDARPTQVAFAASVGSVPYPVLADFEPKGAMSKAYGVYNDERGTPNRAVFIIDKEGVVRWKQEFANVMDIDHNTIMAEIDKL